jgi:methylmalonyl-CoA/ethylmalonyl-CoA epimerase
MTGSDTDRNDSDDTTTAGDGTGDGVPPMPAARVDHVGIAVHDVADAEPTLRALGCTRLHRETAPNSAFEWVTYALGDASRIELVAPVDGADADATGTADGNDVDAPGADTADESFLTRFLADHGPGLHHVTLEVADVDTAVARLEAAGLRVVGYAEADGWTEAFVSPRNPTGALFQLMEYHESYRERGADAALFVGGEPLADPSADEEATGTE